MCISQSLGFSLISVGLPRYTSYKGPSVSVSYSKQEQDSQQSALQSALQIRDRKTIWDKNFERINEYVQNTGTKENGPLDKQLKEWVQRQRRRKRNKDQGLPSTLTDDQEEKLKSLRLFSGDLIDLKWNKRYEELLDYYKEHGHCMVPQRSKTHKGLGLWVHNQRQLYKQKMQGKLPKDLAFRTIEYACSTNWTLFGILLKTFGQNDTRSLLSITKSTVIRWCQGVV
jgi:hypothetical protein